MRSLSSILQRYIVVLEAVGGMATWRSNENLSPVYWKLEQVPSLTSSTPKILVAILPINIDMLDFGKLTVWANIIRGWSSPNLL